MKKNSSGFLLFSFLIYLLLFSLFIMLSFDWVMTFFKKNTFHLNQKSVLISMYLAQDLFLRDIHLAPASFSKWKKITLSEIIWSITDHDIGWTFKEKKLYRNEGNYNKQDQKWDKKTTSVSVQQIDKVNFFINKQVDLSNIKNVVIEYTISGMKPITEIVSLQNRAIE